MGARHITFGDPDFLNGPEHAMRICRALRGEFPGVTFDATIKIEHLLQQRQRLVELRELGCAFIVSAVESLNDTALQHLDKGHTAADVIAAFELMEEVGIPLRPSLLPFSPWETLESYIQLLTFFEERGLLEQVDPVHFSIRLLIPPGSALLRIAERQGWLGELDPSAYTYHWRHPDARMDELHARVLELVERGAAEEADPIATFFQIKALALAAHGGPPQAPDMTFAIEEYIGQSALPPPPRLTEAWFC
jgi:radical SAM superfamily enzyme YgiQ (UPF0313 family)